MVVDSKTGAGGIIALKALQAAKADGYTVGLIPSGSVVQPWLMKDMPFDVRKDFQALSLLYAGPLMLVVPPNGPARDLAEFLTDAKANPGRVFYGSSGAGTATQLAAELMKQAAGIEMTHVPFRGSAEVYTAMLQLADPLMMADLDDVRGTRRDLAPGELLMIPRRINRVMNSVGHTLAGAAEPDTPAYMHPADIAARGLAVEQKVEVRSRHGAVTAALHADETLRPGVVSVVHGFGGRLDDAARTGCSVTRLTAMDEVDRISGIPRLGAIPVTVSAISA